MHFNTQAGCNAICRTLVACAALLLAACGDGTDAEPLAAEAELNPVMRSTTKVSYQPQRTKAVYQVDPGSYTVNPSEQFKGFNHGMWNRARSWTECDCGSEPNNAKAPWTP